MGKTFKDKYRNRFSSEDMNEEIKKAKEEQDNRNQKRKEKHGFLTEDTNHNRREEY